MSTVQCFRQLLRPQRAPRVRARARTQTEPNIRSRSRSRTSAAKQPLPDLVHLKSNKGRPFFHQGIPDLFLFLPLRPSQSANLGTPTTDPPTLKSLLRRKPAIPLGQKSTFTLPKPFFLPESKNHHASTNPHPHTHTPPLLSPNTDKERERQRDNASAPSVQQQSPYLFPLLYVPWSSGYCPTPPPPPELVASLPGLAAPYCFASFVVLPVALRLPGKSTRVASWIDSNPPLSSIVSRLGFPLSFETGSSIFPHLFPPPLLSISSSFLGPMRRPLHSAGDNICRPHHHHHHQALLFLLCLRFRQVIQATDTPKPVLRMR
ncbi:uncharacterized protein CLUP02_15993 [Colletotrichum lupini]|uniref:Uncharacterized protein n=1 Tax=Colletotrichum lupini TaxID=145971 RepID=A0A9Q8T758_9PEZI|nr:uncharacterized protein CLUP02_15993 [Colletotrichum lupini]UQC90463.1 hypothetical protein CLUP02_15993 [Colletotrichum lupini]